MAFTALSLLTISIHDLHCYNFCSRRNGWDDINYTVRRNLGFLKVSQLGPLG